MVAKIIGLIAIFSFDPSFCKTMSFLAGSELEFLRKFNTKL